MGGRLRGRLGARRAAKRAAKRLARRAAWRAARRAARRKQPSQEAVIGTVLYNTRCWGKGGLGIVLQSLALKELRVQ